MKHTTTNVFNLLNNSKLTLYFSTFKELNPSFSFNEVTIGELISQFDYSKEIILQAIQRNVLDERVTYTKRSQMESALKAIMLQLQQLSQYKFNAANANAVPMAQALFKAVTNLTDVVDSCRLEESFAVLSDYSKEIKELTRQRRIFSKLVEDMNKATVLYQKGKSQFDALNVDINNLTLAKKQLQSELSSIQKLRSDIEEINKRAFRADQEIDNRKKKIVAFQDTTNDYALIFSRLEYEANTIISKEKRIDELITQAEHALNLKSAQGISAAFSSYYETAKLSGTFMFYHVRLNWWILGALLFLFSALGLTVWIVGGWYVQNPNDLSSIIGRIVAVFISITGATFCAKQFVKQKNIQEDYAYKSVLSKSIVAFTDEIRKRDDKKVVDYLTTVLSEIHKDPLRTRKENDDKEFGIDGSAVIEKLIDVLKNK